MRHNGIERIRAGSKLSGMGDDPRTLTEIVADEHSLDKGPAHPDVMLATMPQIGIERLGTGRTEKHGTQNEKPLRAGG